MGWTCSSDEGGKGMISEFSYGNLLGKLRHGGSFPDSGCVVLTGSCLVR